MLQIVKERTDEDYKQIQAWLGKGFDPDKFDVPHLNLILAESSETSYEKVTIRRFYKQT